MNERTITMLAQWASNANTNIPAPPVPGQAYRNAELSADNIEQGQRYSTIADSSEWNQFHWIMTGLLQQIEQYGALPWSSLTNYPEGGVCLGLDGMLYQAVQSSGPGNGGAQPTGNEDYWGNYILKIIGESDGGNAHEICEFYNFRHPILRPGFQPRQGGLITDAATQYPEAWAYLQTADGQLLCKSEADWQGMTRYVWGTAVDGTQFSFNGIGGAPFYVQNLNTGTLRLPDTRGMYIEDAGFDSLGVGSVKGDQMRLIAGTLACVEGTVATTGPFYTEGSSNAPTAAPGSRPIYKFNAGRVAPIGSVIAPKRWGTLPCVYLGKTLS